LTNKMVTGSTLKCMQEATNFCPEDKSGGIPKENDKELRQQGRLERTNMTWTDKDLYKIWDDERWTMN
jgi:hypothetical protein